MKPSTLFATLILLLVPCCFGQASPNGETQDASKADPVYSITVAPPADPIRLGSPINVTVTVTNISSKEIYLASDRGPNTKYKDFTYLLMKNGREVETTWFHRKITGRNRPDDPPEVEAGSSITLPHAPGTIFVMTIDLKRLYEITVPGVYTLEVSRFDEYSKTTVRSKNLTLKIVP